MTSTLESGPGEERRAGSRLSPLPARMRPLHISAFTASSALGYGKLAHVSALHDRRCGLRPNDFTDTPLETWIGRVEGLEDRPLPAGFATWECRNNRLAWQTLQADGFLDAVAAARERHGPARVALVLGTSTSSIGASEEAYRRLTPEGLYPEDLRRPIVHTPHSLGDFLQHSLGLSGVSVTIATACSSSAKVFATAERLLAAGVADAAVVGGVDTLCGSVLFGFASLELVSPEPCRPFDVARRGISLGEAGGFALLEKSGESGPWFLGYGESSDAHHMSSPHPEGLGARLALEDALGRAGVGPDQIDYVNLHGTASARNDDVEARLIASTFPPGTRASSTKGWTGHTLGAAGIVEAVLTLLAMEHGLAPGTLNSSRLDEACGPQIRLANEPASIHRALSQSFGFGGSNCVLAFGTDRPG